MVRRLIHPSIPAHLVSCFGLPILGIVTALFFQCMGTLLNPTDRTRGGIKWGLVAHTAAMFSFVTISAAASFDLNSISLIDNREFPGLSIFISGPFGYQDFINTKVICVIPNVMFLINTCLADGFLVSPAPDRSTHCVSHSSHSCSSIVAT